jgi:cytoskeletal protein RodZ
MSFTQNTVSTPDAATQAFWRAAETGNVDELVSVLTRVKDINACNAHGVTALMRAAQHGRLRVVRVLLDRGADANITRNDKFTALALAAFFGHTEVVRALMEHGADSQVSTRHGTSPHMWASARTFSEVVDELENPAPPVEKSAASLEMPVPSVERVPLPPALVAPVSRAVARAAASSTVVRTLKDPPEIWDLVHPAPKGFDARSAFVARLTSMRAAFAFRALSVVVLASVCAAVGVWLLRGAQARTERRMDQQIAPAAVANTENAVVSNASTAAARPAVNTAVPSSAAAPSSVVPSAAVSSPDRSSVGTLPNLNGDASATPVTASDKPGFARRRSSRINSHRADQPSSLATADVSPAVAAPPAKISPEIRLESGSTSKSSAPLSPQVIAPVKSASPAKAKVIQWP